MKARTHTRGFTLIEIMVALAVASIGLLAISVALDRSIDTLEALESKTIASWVASNRLSDLRMSREFRSAGTSQSSETMGGREWRVVDNYYSTEDPNISRVIVQVFHPGSDLPVTENVGFLGRYRPPENL